MTTADSATLSGWRAFAALVVLISGLFSVLQGIVALFAPDPYYVVAHGSLFVFDISGWGWWNLIIGILAVLASGGLFAGALWARIVVVILAILSAIGQLFLIPAQPWWSAILIALDVLVIYAVTAHGGSAPRRPTTS
ncbi:DUF7144 family membrane protein [Leifsonia poae]|uniref:Membrane protein n=1 Tax=Leifsonia poae TaxID=110933 RepID=A0A9W6HBU6_9MICO|nr:hypothetical protein [Leifsonia poae]GLJ77169.1 membrane protein [Leifsonia poae]